MVQNSQLGFSVFWVFTTFHTSKTSYLTLEQFWFLKDRMILYFYSDMKYTICPLSPFSDQRK